MEGIWDGRGWGVGGLCSRNSRSLIFLETHTAFIQRAGRHRVDANCSSLIRLPMQLFPFDFALDSREWGYGLEVT